VAPADFIDFQRLSTSFERMAAYELVDFNLAEQNGPEPIFSGLVTANFFDTLGMKMVHAIHIGEPDQEKMHQVSVVRNEVLGLDVCRPEVTLTLDSENKASVRP